MFASNFLMPEDGIYQYIDLITSSRYEELLSEAGINLNFDEEEEDYVD